MSTYFGSERRRKPRDSSHSFGTIFIRRDDHWMAREILILDANDESVRFRAMPDVRRYEFRLQLDDSDTLYQPKIHRHERKRNSWEFTVSLGQPLGEETLEGLEVAYDFPRVGSKR